MSGSIRGVLDLLNPPVWVVTAVHDETAGGLVATFVMNASIVEDEPRMIVGVARHHFTHQLIIDSGRLGLHLLRSDDVDAARHFGLQSGHQSPKFPWRGSAPSGSVPPVVPQCLARLLAQVETRLNTGDRTIFVCRITEGGLESEGQPMTMSDLIPLFSDDQLQQLQTQLHRDAATDRQAILDWRQEQGIDIGQ